MNFIFPTRTIPNYDILFTQAKRLAADRRRKDMTKHFVWADTMAEAEAIIEHLQNHYDNHSGCISRRDLLVSWRWDELNDYDWQKIYEATLEKLEGTPEYDELLEQGCL